VEASEALLVEKRTVGAAGILERPHPVSKRHHGVIARHHLASLPLQGQIEIRGPANADLLLFELEDLTGAGVAELEVRHGPESTKAPRLRKA
jgi:hypothetical protein